MSRLMSRLTRAVLLLAGLLLVSAAALGAARTQDTGTATVSRDDPAAKPLVEPGVKTRQDLKAAQPLDWNKTIGTPRHVEPTPEERQALANARPQVSEGGPPGRSAKAATRCHSRQETPPRKRH